MSKTDDEANQIEGCVSSAAGPASDAAEESLVEQDSVEQDSTTKERPMGVTVGKEAPDFEASAFHGGGFKKIKLSDFRGKWVFLCFYPGDFTFV